MDTITYLIENAITSSLINIVILQYQQYAISVSPVNVLMLHVQYYQICRIRYTKVSKSCIIYTAFGYLCVSNPHLSLDKLRDCMAFYSYAMLSSLLYFYYMILKHGPLKLFRLGVWGPSIIDMFIYNMPKVPEGLGVTN